MKRLKIGQKITVIRKDDASGQEYYSMVQNIKDDVLYITIPYHGESPLVLMRKEQLKIKYTAQEAVYMFATKCLGTHQETKTLRLYKVAVPGENDIKRVQNRKFVRVPVILDVEYLLPSTEEVKKGLAVDISGGGMRLATKEKLNVNTILDLYFVLPTRNEDLPMKLKARVVRCSLVDDESRVYHVGLEFIHISRGTQDKICSFVFKKQMEQLRRI
ncbi:MAG: PilZ domain-containing protein [Desulfotomaculum sp.]|nr:PilZ domain-containing protein [Desulfotomaculum sp.]